MDTERLLEYQRAACKSVGTKQCAAICLDHLPTYALGECPHVHEVWSPGAIKRELKRRPDGPLKEVERG